MKSELFGNEALSFLIEYIRDIPSAYINPQIFRSPILEVRHMLECALEMCNELIEESK